MIGIGLNDIRTEKEEGTGISLQVLNITREIDNKTLILHIPPMLEENDHAERDIDNIILDEN